MKLRKKFQFLIRRTPINTGYFLLILMLTPTTTLLSGTATIYDNPTWKNSNGRRVDFINNQEIEEFLLTARIKAVEKIPIGVTKPLKLLLEKNGVQMHAVFRSVEISRHRWKSPEGRLHINFHDDCRYEYASYKLSRLLGLHNIPPVVEREFEREDFPNRKLYNRLRKKAGTLQIWIEGAITEKDRREQNLHPSDRLYWFNQQQLMYLFDNLIYNIDRNQGNILIGPDWRIWFIDSTRAYRTFGDLRKPELLKKCDRTLFGILSELTFQDLENALGDCLKDNELRGLFERKEKVVQLYQELIDEKGEELVLVDF
jgi:hypothetical protein